MHFLENENEENNENDIEGKVIIIMVKKTISLSEQYYNFTKKYENNEHINKIIQLMEQLSERPNTPDLRHLEDTLEQNQIYIDGLETSEKEIFERVLNQTLYDVNKKLNKNLTRWEFFKKIVDENGWDVVKEAINIIDENEYEAERVNAGYTDITVEERNKFKERELEDIEHLDAVIENKLKPWVKENVSIFNADYIRRSIATKRKAIESRVERSTDVRFANWLKATRKSKKMTLAELSAKTGTSASYLQRLETGKRKVPTLPVIKAISEGLEVPYYEVLSVIGNEEEEPVSLNEVIEKHEFTIKDEYATSEQKKFLKEILSIATGENFSVVDMNKMSEMVMELQNSINHKK